MITMFAFIGGLGGNWRIGYELAVKANARSPPSIQHFLIKKI